MAAEAMSSARACAHFRRGLVKVAMLSLAACAGGGGGGGGTQTAALTPSPPAAATTPSTPVATASPESFRTPEYLRMGALDQIHAAEAYAMGYTGKGVVVGVVDFNFDFTSAEVNYNSASRGPGPTSQALAQAEIGPLSTDTHGQAVATVLAGAKNDSGIHGVAFNAQILAVDYYSNVNGRQILQGATLLHVSDPWTYLTNNGVRIINASFGYVAKVAHTGLPAATSNAGIPTPSVVRELYRVESPAVAVENGALLVASAGNDGTADPAQSNLDILDDLKAANKLDTGPGAFIIAGAVDANNQIASFSARAGAEANYYLVAPGVKLTVPWNGSLALVSGTSFPAPIISGAAAILMERWPNLTPQQIADILFQTATDLGDPGVDAVYGHGLLNLEAALQPTGVTTFAVASGGAPAVAGSGLVLSTAFGNIGGLKARLSRVTVLDSFGRDFTADASGVLASRSNIPDLFGAIEQRLGWHGASLGIGGTSAIAFDVRRNPEDAILPFQAAGGLNEGRAHDAVVQFNSTVGDAVWTAGTGLSLDDALAPRSAGDPFATVALTQAFISAANAAPGLFAAVSTAIAPETTLSLGWAQSHRLGAPRLYAVPFDNDAQSVALGLQYRPEQRTRLHFEVGDMVEKGGLLGSLASGGLKMADHTSTLWTGASSEVALDARWSVKGALMIGMTAAAHPSASLVGAIGPVTTTSFSLGLGGHDMFAGGDIVSFTLAQPLRAERASLTLETGSGRDASGLPIMAATTLSLVPSGRELDFETGYRIAVNAWNLGANAAYSIDANNIRGKNVALMMLTLSRLF